MPSASYYYFQFVALYGKHHQRAKMLQSTTTHHQLWLLAVSRWSGLDGSLWFSSSTCSGTKPSKISGMYLLQVGCPSNHQTNSVKALKGTQCTDHIHGKSATSLSTTRRLTVGALIFSCWLSDTRGVVLRNLTASDCYRLPAAEVALNTQQGNL